METDGLSLAKKLTDASGKAAQLEDEKVHLQSKISKLEAGGGSLLSDASALERKVSRLDAENVSITKKHTDASEKLALMENEKSQLQTKVLVLEAGGASLAKKLLELELETEKGTFDLQKFARSDSGRVVVASSHTLARRTLVADAERCAGEVHLEWWVDACRAVSGLNASLASLPRRALRAASPERDVVDNSGLIVELAAAASKLHATLELGNKKHVFAISSDLTCVTLTKQAEAMGRTMAATAASVQAQQERSREEGAAWQSKIAHLTAAVAMERSLRFKRRVPPT